MHLRQFPLLLFFFTVCLAGGSLVAGEKYTVDDLIETIDKKQLATTFAIITDHPELVNQVGKAGGIGFKTTPLICAAEKLSDEDGLEVIRALLSAGADPNALPLPAGVSDSNISALSAAAFRGQSKIVKLLLDHSAEVDLKSGPIGWTALQAAFYSGDLATIRLLLDHKADIKVKDNRRYTVIHYAAAGNSIQADVLELALKSGYDINGKDSGGCTALNAYMYSRLGPFDAKNLQCLLDHGADPRQQDFYQQTLIEAMLGPGRLSHYGLSDPNYLKKSGVRSEERAVIHALYDAMYFRTYQGSLTLLLLAGIGFGYWQSRRTRPKPAQPNAVLEFYAAAFSPRPGWAELEKRIEKVLELKATANRFRQYWLLGALGWGAGATLLAIDPILRSEGWYTLEWIGGTTAGFFFCGIFLLFERPRLRGIVTLLGLLGALAVSVLVGIWCVSLFFAYELHLTSLLLLTCVMFILVGAYGSLRIVLSDDKRDGMLQRLPPLPTLTAADEMDASPDWDEARKK